MERTEKPDIKNREKLWMTGIVTIAACLQYF